MKRFWCILVAIIMFGGLTAFAEDMEVTAEYNYADNTVTVSCKNVPDVNIMLALLLPETTLDDAETLGIENVICHMDRKKAADESVIFTYQFPENKVQGIYTAAVSAEGQEGVIEKKFSVASEKEINNIYLQLKNAAGSIEIRKILDEKYEAFNIKDSYELCRRYDLCDSVASAVSDYDYQNGSPLMLQKMIDETAAKLLFRCINKENISEILAFEKKHFDIDTDISSYSETEIEHFIGSLKRISAKDNNGIEEDYTAARLLVQFSSLDWNKRQTFLDKNGGKLKFSFGTDFYNLKYQDKVFQALDVKNIYTAKELQNSFNDAVLKQQSEETPKSGGSSSSNGKSSSAFIPNNTAKETVRQKYFVDISGVEWARQSIERLFDKNIISGSYDMHFCPDDKITREEFTKLVILANGPTVGEYESVFDDVKPENWYYPYVMTGYYGGIISGRSEKLFGAGEPITREDMAVILYRSMKLTGSPDMTEKSFSDSEQISSYAAEAVSRLAQDGYINGYDDGSFRPHLNATRAEAAVMIDRIILAQEVEK